jgi:hypothetical protein
MQQLAKHMKELPGGRNWLDRWSCALKLRPKIAQSDRISEGGLTDGATWSYSSYK